MRGLSLEQVSSDSVYSTEIEAIKKESHRSPRPTFGAPTLVWHLGIWPAPDYDWLDANVSVKLDQRASIAETNTFNICKEDADDKTEFFEGINKVLSRLQSSSANHFQGQDADLKLGEPPVGLSLPILGPIRSRGRRSSFRLFARIRSLSPCGGDHSNEEGPANQEAHPSLQKRYACAFRSKRSVITSR